MEEFKIEAKQGIIKIVLKKVAKDLSLFGGYEADGNIEIKSGNYFVNGQLRLTTDELMDFYEQLEKCCHELSGTAVYNNYESSLCLKVEMSSSGLAVIYGFFQEEAHFKNKLFFEFETEKSHLTSTLDELKALVESKAA